MPFQFQSRFLTMISVCLSEMNHIDQWELIIIEKELGDGTLYGPVLRIRNTVLFYTRIRDGAMVGSGSRIRDKTSRIRNTAMGKAEV
jgi:hypothetical protein